MAIFLAIGLDPIVSRFERRGMRRGFAIVVVFGGFALLVAGFVALIVPDAGHPAGSLIDNLPDLFNELRQNETIRNLDDKYQIIDKIQHGLTGRVDEIFSGVLGAAQVLAGVVFSILTITILTLYFLAAFHPMKAMAYRLAPASRRAARHPADRRDPAAGRRLRHRAADHQRARRASAPTSSCASPTCSFASALALLIALFSLIPMVGATIGSVLVSLDRLDPVDRARHRDPDLLHHLPAGGELPRLPARDEASREHPPGGRARRCAHRREPARIRRAPSSRSRAWPRSS